jgi:hypothetical protein
VPGCRRSISFRKAADFDAFERVIVEAHQREPIRILAYCILSWPLDSSARAITSCAPFPTHLLRALWLEPVLAAQIRNEGKVACVRRD